MMGVSRDTAYRMIRSLRSDLIADGQLAKGYPSGKIPKKAFNKLYMFSFALHSLLGLLNPMIK